jgi:hypothetical protein
MPVIFLKGEIMGKITWQAGKLQLLARENGFDGSNQGQAFPEKFMATGECQSCECGDDLGFRMLTSSRQEKPANCPAKTEAQTHQNNTRFYSLLLTFPLISAISFSSRWRKFSAIEAERDPLVTLQFWGRK